MNPTPYESISVTWAIVSQKFYFMISTTKDTHILNKFMFIIKQMFLLIVRKFFLEDFSCGFSCFEWELCLLLLKRFNAEYGSFE